jgi:hypothetical protein
MVRAVSYCPIQIVWNFVNHRNRTMKDRPEQTAREYIHQWKSGGRRHVLEQLTGSASDPEIPQGEVAAVTALMMSHLPTWLDQVELRDGLVDIAKSSSLPRPASPRPK